MKARIYRFSAVVLFALVTTPTHSQSFSVLYSFGTNPGDPVNPQNPGTIAQGRDGNLYSTAPSGGANGGGAVFRITPTGDLTVLHSFETITQDSGAWSGLTLGTDGNFYGTTFQGGTSGFGTLFKMAPNGQFIVLYNFTGGSDGGNPYAAPIQGTDGDFYGTTADTVYRLTPPGELTTLHQLSYAEGSGITAPLVQATDGNFYGTATQGGGGSGTVFSITPSGKLIVLYTFGLHDDGEFPDAPLIQGSDGNFYGTTQDGLGGTNFGIVFKITPSGNLTVLHRFSGNDGASLYGGLMQANDGSFYGVAGGGGTSNNGTIFRITPTGAFSVLYNFDGTSSTPQATLLQHTSGIFYGDSFGGSPQGTFYSWTAGLKPLTHLLPYSGRVGETIEFLGQGFTSATTVSFNGMAATPIVKSGTYLTAAVPSGATTGFVTVTTSGVTLKSNKTFRVTPQIKSFTPPSGSVGTVVTIIGVSLTQTTKVMFGGVAATSFTVNSDTQVTATVPTGAKTGKIAITTPGGIASSTTRFTVT